MMMAVLTKIVPPSELLKVIIIQHKIIEEKDIKENKRTHKITTKHI